MANILMGPPSWPVPRLETVQVKRVLTLMLLPLLLALALSCGGDDSTAIPAATATAAATVVLTATLAAVPTSTATPTPSATREPTPTSTPAPTPTPVSTPEPTRPPTPQPTPAPTPEPTPEPTLEPEPVTPIGFGSFEDPELGIRFDYHDWWQANKQEGSFTWMRAIDR